MKINISELPAFPKIEGRAVTAVSRDQLKTLGTGASGNSILEGDVIEFDEDFENMKVVQQPIRPNATSMNYMVGVLKNGKPAWFSLGSLIRRYNGPDGLMPTCPFVKEMLDFGSHEDRLKHLAGKKIKGSATVKLPYYKWDREKNVRLDETEDRNTTIIEYVE